MNLIFFQNCLSPHQIPYIRECAKDERVDKVYFVMPRIDYEERSDMGWSNDMLLNESTVEFILKPTDEMVRELLDVGNKDVRCLFSGIRADADVFRWLNISIAFNVKRYIITEPPYIFDKPLWMHYVRFFLQDYKYVKHIDGVFAIGESCEKYYSSISKRWRVFPFIYVTLTSSISPMEEVANESAILIDPTNPKEIRRGYEIMSKEANSLIERGLKNVERFALDKITKQYLDVYKIILKNNE